MTGKKNLRSLVPATVVGLALVTSAAPALAGASYLTQMRFVEATVDGGGEMVDMERRASMAFGPFARVASASLELPDGVTGSATVAQASLFDADGITAEFGGSFSTSGTGLTSSVKTVLATTFVLDGPHSYEFFPYGGSPELTASGSGVATLIGSTGLDGPDIALDLTVADGQAIGEAVDEPLTGELAGGEYTFRYEFVGNASDGLLDFAFNPSLLFTEIGGGGVPEVPTVIPLPGAATAGLTTLAGLMIAGRFRKARRA